MTVNKTGLQPLGHAILCEPYEPELKATKIAIPETVRAQTRQREIRAIVIEIGPDAWKERDGYTMSERCQPGDKVLIARFSGAIVQSPVDGKDYRICNDEDVYCRITAESWEQVKIVDPVLKAMAERKAVGGR